MYCKKCGTEQHLGQKFCPKCGTPFPVIEKEEKVVEEKETMVEDVEPETVEPEIVEQDNATVTEETESIVETPVDIEKEDKEEIVEDEKIKEENTVADDYVEELSDSQPNQKCFYTEFDSTAEDKDFASQVLRYLRRSKSEKQIITYAGLYHVTMSNLTNDIAHSDVSAKIFGESIKRLESEKNTNVHYLNGEELAKYIEKHITDWQESSTNHTKANRKINEEDKNERTKKILFVIGAVIVVLPFLLHGFSFGWFWYLLIAMVGYTTYTIYVQEAKIVAEVKKVLLSAFCAIGAIMLVWGPLNPNYSSGFGADSSEIKERLEAGTLDEDDAKALVIYYLRNHMKNPSSYEPVYWGGFRKVDSNNDIDMFWIINHTYRGTNSFGGVVTESHAFHIYKSGRVDQLY